MTEKQMAILELTLVTLLVILVFAFSLTAYHLLVLLNFLQII